MVREDIDGLVQEVEVVALEAAVLGSDWTLVRRTALDVADTAAALPASDQEAADNLRTIARVLAAHAWKMAERRIGYKGGSVLKTKLGNPKIRTAVLVGLRGRG